MTKYTEEHEWVRIEADGTAVIGITNHAQEQLGELVYVELPAVGDQFSTGESTGVVESTKTASDINAPFDCEVIEVNTALEDDPSVVNSAAETDGWLYKVKINDVSQLEQLLDAEEI